MIVDVAVENTGQRRKNLHWREIVAAFFCFIELTSINENIKAVYCLKLFQMFKQLLSRVKEVKDDITSIGPEKKGPIA